MNRILPFARPLNLILRMVAVCVASSAAQLCAQTLGTMNMGGNPDFSADSIAQTRGPERRWHSFPGGRLSLNPSAHKTFMMDPTPADLSLDLGGYIGSDVLRLPKVACMVLVDANEKEMTPVSQRTDWFPYKLTLHSQHAAGASLSADDCFTDADSSLLRVIEVLNAGTQQLQLSGSTPDNASLEWQAEKKAILVTGEKYYYSLCFASLTGAEDLPKPTSLSPDCSAAGWKIKLPLESGNGRYTMGFGFATREEGSEKAIERSRNTISQPVKTTLTNSRALAEEFLRKVPAPTVWGLDPQLAAGITSEQQRQAYYIAWSFLQQSTIDVLPEKPDFEFPQMSLGKASLWADGEHRAPATCAWESLIGVQWLSLVDPGSAWGIYEGIMSLVDADGLLGGESLPSRKAETAWRIYQKSPDRKRLAEVYPAIKRYLTWREANPRWIWGNNKAADERDLEFVVSWLYDLEFAARIATELDLPADAALWSSKEAPAIGQMRDWFFNDPQRLHQLYFTERKVHSTPERSSERPIMTLSALRIRALPDDMSFRLLALWNETAHPELANAGFNYTKYPDNQFVALGLLDRKQSGARPFIEAILRDSIRAGEFTECLVPGKDNQPALDGVKPSLFTALNIIDFTWLLNQVRCDTGRPQAFVIPPLSNQ
ncbi:MAG: hypothetical protein RLZZ245_2115 [Verrucomicrobiota bacterium]